MDPSPRSITRCCTLLLALCLAWPVAAAVPGGAAGPNQAAPLRDHFLDTWTTRQGLPHNAINAIVQTPEGYLWFATWEGAARFNGREFVNFDRDAGTGLPDSGVRALLLDHDGALLVGGSRGGMARHHGGRWAPYDPAPGLITRLLRDASGRLWAGTESAGLLLVDVDGARTHFTPDNGLPGDSTYGIVEDGEGTVWVATSGGLVGFDAEGGIRPAPDPRIGQVPVFSVALAPDGRVVAGTGAGVLAFDPSQGVAQALHPSLRETVTALLYDSRDELWIGTVSRGLFRASRTHGLESLDADAGLPNNRVLALFEDRDGSLWVGTAGGVVRLGDALFSSLTRERGLADDYVRTVMRHSDGSLWIGSGRGVDRWVDGRLQPVPALARESVLSLAEARDGSVWVGSFASGALRVADGSVVEQRSRADGLPSDEVRALLEEPDGTLWVGTTHGLVRLSGGAMRLYRESDGLPGDYIVTLMQAADGAVWVGTGVGVAVIDGAQVRPVPLDHLNQAEFAFDIVEEPETGSVWLATDRGLVRLRASDGHAAVIARGQGLPFDKLFSVVPDHEGNLWLSGNRGVIRVAAAEAHAVADGRRERLEAELYSEADGMASSQANGGSSPAAALAADGSVWIATARGVAVVQPARLQAFGARVPPMVIERVRVDGVDHPLDAELSLPAGTGRIQIDVAGLGFVVPERIRYRYRLQGFDADWVDRGTQRYAEFTNLPPGRYVFEAVAANPGGPWSPEPARLAFDIAPHLWQRPAAWVLGLLLVAGMVVGVVVLRERRLRGNEARLRQQVDLRTAELAEQARRLLEADSEKSQLVDRLREQSEAFERQSLEDALTGLPNRRAFDRALAREFKHAVGEQRHLSLALLDIDHFKRINDRYSHAVGDQVLQQVATVMRRHLREFDAVSRWGGEEFALMFPGSSLETARAICERLREAIADTAFETIAPGLRLTVSIGLAGREGVDDHDRLLARADAALYAAKSEGRNRVRG